MSEVLFVSDYKYKVKDGLYKAIQILGYDTYNIGDNIPDFHKYKFILGHGAFGSRVDTLLSTLDNKKGLCIGGNVNKYEGQNYDVFFYETEWVANYLNLPREKSFHAFGINEDIFYPRNKIVPIGGKSYVFDYLSVGSFALWKHHNEIIKKSGVRAVIGEIQIGNKKESYQIIEELLANGVAVFPQMTSEEYALILSNTKTLFMASDVFGGGERAVMEAMAVGCNIEIKDNPKLEEIVKMGVKDSKYYAQCLKI